MKEIMPESQECIYRRSSKHSTHPNEDCSECYDNNGCGLGDPCGRVSRYYLTGTDKNIRKVLEN